MKNYLVLVLLLLWSGPGYSQPSWQATTPFTYQNTQSTNILAVHPVSNALFVGKEEGGILRSTDQGDSWQEVAAFPVYSISIRADGSIFAGGEGVIYRSTDHGQTWTSHQTGSSYPLSKIVFNSSGHLFAGTAKFIQFDSNEYEGDGVLKSADNGQSWTALNNGLTGSLAVQTLAIDTQDKLYAGITDGNSAEGGGLYALAANATTWQHLPIAYNNTFVINVAYAEALVTDADDNVYFSLSGSFGSVGATGTVKSVDGGASWTVVSTTSVPPTSLLVPYFISLFVAQDGMMWGTLSGGGSANNGLHYSTNHGATWTRYQSGTQVAYGYTSFAQASDGQLYSLRHYHNIVYKPAAPLSADNPIENIRADWQVYPNPFQDELHINYHLQAQGPVRIRVTDALGRIVFEQEQQVGAGTRTFAWEPTGAVPGLYVVQLTAGQQRLSKKVLLTR